jgi:hypothetical protein
MKRCRVMSAPVKHAASMVSYVAACLLLQRSTHLNATSTHLILTRSCRFRCPPSPSPLLLPLPSPSLLPLSLTSPSLPHLSLSPSPHPHPLPHSLTFSCTPSPMQGFVGSTVIYEDEGVRVWNFTLAAGATTSMHRHDYDYHFVVIKPTQLEVWGENGDRLFDFRAEGVMGFKLIDELLVPQNHPLPFPVPRTHAAKNIGPDDYYEILFEHKVPQPIPKHSLDPDL